MSVLFSFLIVPPSLFVKLMSAFSFASMCSSGISEFRGKHMRYSKFVEVNAPRIGREAKVPSKIGMLVAYMPAFVVSLLSLVALEAAAGPRSLLLRGALTLHFLKRVLEVMFIHQYSGQMTLLITIQISLSYFISTATMIYAQHLTGEMSEPVVDLKHPGIAMFLIGITGNFYHHYCLSKLRGKGDKGYKIPTGGLFGLVICPHYLFEIIEFTGVAFISQTVYTFSFAVGCMFYLMGRSSATRRWYSSKFENFPPEIKALIPYIY